MMRAPKNYAVRQRKPWARIKRLVIANNRRPVIPSAGFTFSQRKLLPIRRIRNHRRRPLQPRRNLPAVAEPKFREADDFLPHHAPTRQARRFFSQDADGELLGFFAGAA